MPGPDLDYETWSEFRYLIRRYLRTAEGAARDHGLEPQQHQLLLAVRGYPKGEAPTIGDLAERLQLRHHSTVELVNRMEQSGLVRRQPTGVGRAVAVKLTPQGRRALDSVSDQLEPELGEAGHELISSLLKLVGPERSHAASRKPIAAKSAATPRPARNGTSPASTPAPRARSPRAVVNASPPARKPRSTSPRP